MGKRQPSRGAYCVMPIPGVYAINARVTLKSSTFAKKIAATFHLLEIENEGSFFTPLQNSISGKNVASPFRQTL